MTLNLRIVSTSFALCALLVSSATANETILKLSLASTSTDLSMNASGVLGTSSDGIGGTTGDQNTAIDFTGYLDPLFADVTTNSGSFSLTGIQRTGAPSIVGGAVVLQDFFGGTFNLYNASNTLLLSGNLQDSLLTGVIGGNGTGSFFTTKVGTFTSGLLLPYVQSNSLNVSIGLSGVKNAGGEGFLVSGAPFTLQPFTADASVSISADQGIIPEPASIAIALLGAVGFAFTGRRRA